MELVKRLKERRIQKRILAGAVIFLILFAITGFFVAPPIIKSVLIKQLSAKLHREVTIRKVRVNPFMLSVDIQGFAVKDRTGSATFVSFEELYVNLQTASIWKGGPILKEIKIDRPYLNIIRNEDGSYNFSDLLEEEKPKSAAESKPFKFSFNNIQLLNGSLDFLDGPKQTRHKARDVVIKIPFISNLPHYVETFVQPLFEAKINDTPVSFKGETKPFTSSRETIFHVNVKDFDIPYYLAYVPFKMKFKLLSGYVDTRVAVSYTQHVDKAPVLDLTGDIDIKKIQVADQNDNRMISLPMVNISITSSDLMARNVHFSKLFFQSPEIDVVRAKTGKLNLESLVPQLQTENKEEKKEEKKEDSKPAVIDADAIGIAGGRVLFTDSAKTSVFKTTIEDINLKVSHFSTSPDKKTAAELSLQTEAKEALKVTGDFSVSPAAAEGTFELKDVPIKKYSPYFSDAVLFDVEDGRLDLLTRYSFSKTKEEPEIRLSGLSAALASLRLKKRDEKEYFLNIPLISLKETDMDLTKKELVVGSISTQKGLAFVTRYSDGKMNIENLVPPPPKKGEKPPAVKKGQQEKAWQVLVKDLAVDGYSVKVEDRVPAQAVKTTVDKIKISGRDITTKKNSRGRLSASLTINGNGSLSTNGSVTLDPPSLKTKLNAKALSIVPFQPYFTDRVKIILTGGSVSANGDLSVSYAKDTGPKVVYAGEASLTNFSSVDKANADDFLKWDSLHFGGINAGYNPTVITIDAIALSDFYSRLIINRDGSLNVQGIVEAEAQKPEPQKTEAAPEAKTAAPAETGGKSSAPKMIKISTVTLQGGTINFSDRHIEPSYSANLLEIGGRISGLTSEEDKFADADLKGKLDNYAPLEITGKMNPLRDDLYVDLKVDFRDMDLSPMTPYSGRYAGYTIQKGKLNLNLKYLIVKRKLDSQNVIFLDQFTLGEKVESPDATKLPVRLAVALLKNRKGEIKLDIPVTGYIDDPKFSIGKVVLKIILNLLAKAATSPFALLGAIFGGGGEELSYIDFDYGNTAINDEGAKKIDKLIKALDDRPALKMEIEGHVDTEKDREGLRDYLFNKKIKAQKLKDMIKKGLPPVPVDEVKVEKEEYPKYLKMAYKEEKFPKPRNIIGIAKDLPPAEMEKLMTTHIQVTDDDLRQLASQRASKVKDLILKSAKIEPERIFLVQPKTLAPEKKEKLRDSRVDFKLK